MYDIEKEYLKRAQLENELLQLEIDQFKKDSKDAEKARQIYHDLVKSNMREPMGLTPFNQVCIGLVIVALVVGISIVLQ